MKARNERMSVSPRYGGTRQQGHFSYDYADVNLIFRRVTGFGVLVVPSQHLVDTSLQHLEAVRHWKLGDAFFMLRIATSLDSFDT